MKFTDTYGGRPDKGEKQMKKILTLLLMFVLLAFSTTVFAGWNDRDIVERIRAVGNTPSAQKKADRIFLEQAKMSPGFRRPVVAIVYENNAKTKYDKAIEAAIEILSPLADEYLREGFATCVGASGTIQSLQEIMISNGESEVVTLEKLIHLKEMTLEYGAFSKLNIAGLSAERLTVFPSGLSILIAIFRILDIKGMTLAGGALREGVIYRMLGDYAPRNIRTKTVDSLITRYQIDREQAERVTKVSLFAFDNLKEAWQLNDPSARPVLKWASMLYEIGLCIEYKKAPKHASYIIDNIEMPGFTNAQKHLLSALLLNERDAFKLEALKKQSAVSYEEACALARILRLAIIICVRRSPDAIDGEISFNMPEYGRLELVTTKDWLDNHYLRATLLKEECQRQQELGWSMTIREK